MMLINEMVWTPLLNFVDAIETTEMGEPEHLDHFRNAFKAALKRDGFWHPIIAETVASMQPRP